MKILYVCHRFPFPPKRGGKIRPFNMIKHLSENHEVTVASLVRSDDEAQEGQGLKDFCHQFHMEKINKWPGNIRMVSKLFSIEPSSMGYFYSPKLEKDIQNEIKQNAYDLIFVHCSSVAQYVENIADIPKILDFGDMDSQKWLEYSRVRTFPLTLGYWLEGNKMLIAEKKLAKKFDYCSCTTKAEKQTLDEYGVTDKTFWFPNGVDYEFFKPDDIDYVPNSVCFIGRMDYYPNQECMFDFCENILPLLKEKNPDITLTIIGANPSPKVKDLGNISGVTVTGSVDDVRPYVLKSAVNVAPLNIARGTQNKILESMAMGVPVVASVAAAGGIDAEPGEHFLMAQSPQEYADAIVRLLDPSEREKFSKAGRERIVSHHDWDNSMKRLDTLIEKCMGLSKKDELQKSLV